MSLHFVSAKPRATNAPRRARTIGPVEKWQRGRKMNNLHLIEKPLAIVLVLALLLSMIGPAMAQNNKAAPA